MARVVVGGVQERTQAVEGALVAQVGEHAGDPDVGHRAPLAALALQDGPRGAVHGDHEVIHRVLDREARVSEAIKQQRDGGGRVREQRFPALAAALRVVGGELAIVKRQGVQHGGDVLCGCAIVGHQGSGVRVTAVMLLCERVTLTLNRLPSG